MSINFLKDYYGGRTLPQVAQTIRKLKTQGCQAAVSILPRFRLGRVGIREEKNKYLGILPYLESQGVTADLTVKLSQFGQRWAFQECVKALDEVAAHCRSHGAFLWVDMEQSALVDMTIEAFESVAGRYDNVGICLQTVLRRTPDDLEDLLKRRRAVRLVKGYYREWPPAAFDTWEETTRCFADLIPPLLERSVKPTIATHDPWLLDEARKAVAKAPVPAGATNSIPGRASCPSASEKALPAGGPHEAPRVEFQFFQGAKPELPAAMAQEGRRVRVYIPFGALVPYILHSLPFMDIGRNIQRVLKVEKIR